jgi:uncharacterized protein (DUF433 family)
MADTSTQYKYLAPGPNSRYRQLFIKGTKFSARQIYGQHVNEEEPRTVQELAENYDLPVEAVEEAIAYCRTDPPEIRHDFAMEEAFMEARGMNDPNYRYNPRPKPLSPQEIAAIYKRFGRRGFTSMMIR